MKLNLQDNLNYTNDEANFYFTSILTIRNISLRG